MIENGRRTEIRTHEEVVNGTTQRTTEHYEEIIPLEKKKRIIEKIVPVVMERITEKYDDGQVSRTIEHVSTEDMPLELRPAPLSAADVEAIFRKIVSPSNTPVTVPTQSFWSKFKFKSAAPSASSNIVSYVLITLLAAQVGFLIWQIFIR